MATTVIRAWARSTIRCIHATRCGRLLSATTTSVAGQTAGITTKADGHLHDAFESEVRPFLDVADELRAVGLEHEMPIPQIAVMGDQSSGKSSVLEAISGLPFPRGTGLVTKCATQLSMRKGPVWKATSSILWHDGDKDNAQPDAAGPIENAADVGTHIGKLTEAVVAGSGSDFSQDIICINVESPELPELTLIDLPEIVRTTTGGQKKDVIDQVDNLITKFLNQERTIVLAVVPANQDVATVDILERAAEVDPDGDRTLAVLTKPDLIDEGSEDEVRSVLENTRKPIKLGWTMVKLRSQKDLDDGMNLNTARHEEAKFLTDHQVFKDVDPSLLGIPNLIERLKEVLVSQIKHHLPEMKVDIDDGLSKVKKTLEELGPAPPSTGPARAQEFEEIVQKYAKRLREETADATDGDPYYAKPYALYTRCRKHFQDFQRDIRRMEPDFTNSGYRPYRDIAEKAIKARRGRELPGFVSSDVFDALVSIEIRKWKESGLRTFDDCCRVVDEGSHDMLNSIASQYPTLVEVVAQATKELIAEERRNGKRRIEDLFEQELRTLNHYVLDAFNAIRGKQLTDSVTKTIVKNGDPLMSSVIRLDDIRRASVDLASLYGVSSATCILHLSYDKEKQRTAHVKVFPSRDSAPVRELTGNERGHTVVWSTALRQIENSEVPVFDVPIMTVEDLDMTIKKFSGVSNEEQEVDLMLAYLQAYLKVASKRIVDEVPLITDNTLLSTFSKKLEEKLSLLRPNDEQFESYFSETSRAETRRKEAMKKKERLEKAADVVGKSNILSNP